MPENHEVVPFAVFCNGINRTEAAARGWIRKGTFPLPTFLLDGRRVVIVPGGSVERWNTARIATEVAKAKRSA